MFGVSIVWRMVLEEMIVDVAYALSLPSCIKMQCFHFGILGSIPFCDEFERLVIASR